MKIYKYINEETGLWIAGICFLIVMVGGILAFLGALFIGRLIVIFFGIIFILGMLLHFIMNWKTIFLWWK